MKKIFSLLVAALFLFAACDKIDEDKYIVFSGAAGTWYDSEVEIPQVQRAFVEKYTGVRCQNCPKGDQVIHTAMEKYGDRLVVAAVHVPNNFSRPFSGQPDLRTDKGSEWFNAFFSPSQGIPAALLNRQKVNGSLDIINPTGGFDDKIDAVVNNNPTVSMFMETGNEGENSFADVHIRFDQTVAEPLTLTLLVVEDKIYTTQTSGNEEIENYEQNHVLRAIITDTWGIDVDADGQQGTKRMVRLSYQLPETCNSENCHLIAFVSNKNTREILNSVQCDVL